jgi:hypothetical protein
MPEPDSIGAVADRLVRHHEHAHGGDNGERGERRDRDRSQDPGAVRRRLSAVDAVAVSAAIDLEMSLVRAGEACTAGLDRLARNSE